MDIKIIQILENKLCIRSYSAEFKAKVALEMLKKEKTLSELS